MIVPSPSIRSIPNRAPTAAHATRATPAPAMNRRPTTLESLAVTQVAADVRVRPRGRVAWAPLTATGSGARSVVLIDGGPWASNARGGLRPGHYRPPRG